MRVRMLIVGVVALASVAACGGKKDGDGVASAGGPGKGASASPSLKPEDARLKFAQCMRQNGVDMPDPSGERGVQIKSRKGDEGKTEAAMKKCQPILKAGGEMPDINDPKMHDQMVRFAQCMRQNGVDMPDPKPGEGMRLRMKRGDNPATAEKAQKACQHLAPGRMR
ncbi:hypothetical protein [Actinomadura kijaniata]|uniref:hypothetical protein n=1 Tax=Actinomadura kijaniata TaxID=46161 RepID=UPI00083750B5|nr:hypothetical protein [Actinomadura kijaniata]